jgi:uncharacterized protein YndB with AHSA1/START domain
MDDAARVLGLTTRSVSLVELDGRPAHRAVLSRAFPTAIDDLWDALTSAERIPRWFLPIEGDLRVGGRYQLQGNAGGTIEECEPPRRFRVSWGMGGEPTWVTVTLRPEGTRTVLELEHVGRVPTELWDRFGPSATGIGWDLALTGLAEHLATGHHNDPGARVAWMASAQGVSFLEFSAARWQEVDVAAGTPAVEAAARAGHALDFYTGRGDQEHP